MAKNRSIDKVIIIPNVGVVITHSGEREKGAKGVKSKTSETVYADPSESFKTATKRLTEALIGTTSLSAFESAMNTDKVASNFEGKALNSMLKAIFKYIGNSVTVKSIVIKHVNDELKAVQIAGTYVNPKGDSLSIKSPMIQLDQVVYGWEAKLIEAVEAVKAQALEFLNGEYQKIEVIEKVKEEKSEEPKGKEKVVKKQPKLDLELDDLDDLPAAKKVTPGSVMRSVTKAA
jgi:stage V sporulation protein SpoVS